MSPIDIIKEALEAAQKDMDCGDWGEVDLNGEGATAPYSHDIVAMPEGCPKCKVDAALTALDSLTIKVAPSPWISVSDRLPPIHEEPFPESGFVLILLQHEGWKPDIWKTMKASRTIAEWDDNGDPLWFWSDEDGEIIDDDDNLITHWMEIPSPLYPTK